LLQADGDRSMQLTLDHFGRSASDIASVFGFDFFKHTPAAADIDVTGSSTVSENDVFSNHSSQTNNQTHQKKARKKKYTGGWSTKVAAGYNTEVCEIASQEAKQLSIETFVKDYLSIGRPVKITNALKDWPAFKTWSRKKLTKLHGSVIASVSGIPYADAFGGIDGKRIPLKDFVRKHWGSTNKAGEVNYLFEAYIERKAPAIMKDIKIPAYFNSSATSTQYFEFILGPGLSGSPLHFHNDAWNALIFGKKRWFLLPPASTQRSNLHPTAWVPAASGSNSPRLQHRPIYMKECVQEAGDLLFVPLHWGHATLNLQDSVGIASEFSTKFTPHSVDGNALFSKEQQSLLDINH